MNHYEQKQEARRERLERAAAKARQESDSRFTSARDRLAGIPPGQPILVGHHSEKRHRGALRKHDNDMRKAFAADERAKELASRAASVGSGGISSDDPDAVAKLTDKRTELEKERDHMKAVNAAFRKKDSDTLVALTGRTFEQWQTAVAGNYSWDRQPFAKYQLTNIGARIRDAAKRTAVIEKVQTLEYEQTEINGVTLTLDPADNRITLQFPARLSKDDYKRVRGHGFLWSPTRNGFTRKISGNAVYHARELAKALGTQPAPEGASDADSN